MKKLIEEFIYKSYREILDSGSINELKNTAEINKKRLKENLSKKQQNLLLRMEDAKDLITEKCGYKSFIAGFKLGLKIGYETNKD